MADSITNFIDIEPQFISELNMDMAAQATHIGDFSNSINQFNTDIRQTQVAIDNFNLSLEKTIEINNEFSVNKEFNNMQVSIYNIGSELDMANKKQKALNNSIKDGADKSKNLFAKVKEIAKEFNLMDKAKKLFATADTFTQNQIQLSQINDGLQSTEELNKKVYATAQRTRSGYSNMLSVIDTLGTKAGDAFSSNDEMLYFSELLTKSFKSAGMSAKEQSTAIEGIANAMGSGGLTGDGGAEILKNTPEFANILANSLGVTTDQLNQMAIQGSLTSDVIKQAMYGASESINAKFEETPATFSEIFTSIKDQAMMAFLPIIEKLSAIATSEQFATMVSTMGDLFQTLAGGVMVLYNLLEPIGAYIADNWSIFEPIILGIASAITAWTIATKLQILNSIKLSEAWKIVSQAIKANPFIAIISVIIGLIMLFIRLWNTNDKFAAAVYRIWNSLLNFFDQVPIFFKSIWFGVIEKFLNAKVEILTILEELINGVIDGINWMIEKLNTIPGVQIDAIAQVEFASQAALEAEAIKQANQDEIEKMKEEAESRAFEREQKVLEFIKEREEKRASEEEAINDFAVQEEASSKSLENQLSSEGVKVSDTVDVASEDIKVMRDLAERKAIENFVTLTPTVSVTTGDIRNGMEVDDIVNRIVDVLDTEIATNAKGVYAT